MRHDVALVEWFSYVGESIDEDTGMWVVQRAKQCDGLPLMDFIFIDSIRRGCQLLPIYGENKISNTMTHASFLHAFQTYYVNKFADHHLFEILS